MMKIAMAMIGPSDWYEPRSASNNSSAAIISVPPAERIDSLTARIVVRMASWVSDWRSNSSRNREAMNRK
jgi:hypothetical protein